MIVVGEAAAADDNWAGATVRAAVRAVRIR
jgi:hypothetical protein